MIERTYIDKSDWPDGEWKNEPDKVLFVDEYSGYPCIIRRIRFGALCGYVGVGSNHPLYMVEYGDTDINIHGGLTYSARCDGDEELGICHPSDNDDIWWLGFDCAHANCDVIPGNMDLFDSFINTLVSCVCETYQKPTYKNLEFVKSQCKSLASQLKALEIANNFQKGANHE